MEPRGTQRYDVAILGSGVAGSILGAILARQGVRTLLLDAGSHPRFAIGESTIPFTLVSLRTLAERYDVPEIAHLASFTDTTRAIGPRFGVKRHFGFLLHHEGAPQNPREVNEFATPPQLLHEAAHLFRQDTDSYLFHVAVKYGCVARQNFRVTDIDFDGSGVTLSGQDGEYRARYLVDASGFRSPSPRSSACARTPAGSSTTRARCGTTSSASRPPTGSSTPCPTTGGRRCPGTRAPCTTCSSAAGAG